MGEVCSDVCPVISVSLGFYVQSSDLTGGLICGRRTDKLEISIWIKEEERVIITTKKCLLVVQHVKCWVNLTETSCVDAMMTLKEISENETNF